MNIVPKISPVVGTTTTMRIFANLASLTAKRSVDFKLSLQAASARRIVSNTLEESTVTNARTLGVVQPCDTEHLFWICPAFNHIRLPFGNAVDRILAALDSKAKFRAAAIRELLQHNAFRKCGIVFGDIHTLKCAYDANVI